MLPPPSAAAQEQIDEENAQQELKQTVQSKLSEMTEQIGELDFTKLGIAGLLVLVWAAVSLVVRRGGHLQPHLPQPPRRRWHYRIAIYWSLITLGPVLLVLSAVGN